MDFETIVVTKEDAVALIRLNRPDKLNALNATVRRELMEAFDALEGDASVKVVILHGSGDKAFVAGADVGEFASRTPAEQRAVYQRRRIYETVADFPKPVIAAIHGFCIGGGSELALACDIRVADATARIGQFEIRLGLIPGGGGTQRLARLVGPGQALRISLTGDLVGAEEAHRIGLVEFLTEEGGHLDKAKEVAARMCRWSPLALRLGKQAVYAALETPMTAGLELEKELFLAAFASDDGREGVSAFMDKREPEFTGS